MAWRRNSALLRRLAAIADATRRQVGHRRWLRERAAAARTIRLAALRAKLNPNDIPGLDGIAYTPNQLAEQGVTPERERADTAFIAHDPVLAAHRGWAEKVADRMPRFAGDPPRGRGASLDDWYAWALARQRPAVDVAAPRREVARRQVSRDRGTKWKRRTPRKLLEQALRRLRDAERRPLGFALFSRASRALR